MKWLVVVGCHRYNNDRVYPTLYQSSLQVLHTFNDVIWHVSWSITGDILAVSGGDNKVSL